MGSWVERTHSKVVDGWRTEVGKVVAGRPGEVEPGSMDGPTFACRETGRNNWGATQTMQPRVPAWEKKASKPLTEKTCGG